MVDAIDEPPDLVHRIAQRRSALRAMMSPAFGSSSHLSATSAPISPAVIASKTPLEKTGSMNANASPIMK
jgi:hypothetical protein